MASSDNAASVNSPGAAREPSGSGERSGAAGGARKDDVAEGSSTPASGNNQGGKSEKLVKTYCN